MGGPAPPLTPAGRTTPLDPPAHGGLPAPISPGPTGPSGPGGHSWGLAVAHVVLGRMLDEGDDPAGHEACRPHGRPGPGDLAHLDDSSAGADLHPAPGPRRRYLVGPGPVAGIDHYLYPVALHGTPLPQK